MPLMSECKRTRRTGALKGLIIEDVRDARTEMMLHAALGAALTFTTGPVAETAAAWTTTLRLAERLGDTEYRLRARRGLWSHRMNASEYRPALALANEFCALAESEAETNDARRRSDGQRLILHYLGAQTEARRRIGWSVGDVVSLLRGSHRRLRASWLIKALPRMRCSHASSGCKDFRTRPGAWPRARCIRLTRLITRYPAATPWRRPCVP